jgi:hypothetical protein
MPLRMPEIKMNSWPGISTTLFINNSWVRIRKIEKASNTIFWSACFDLHLTRPKIEMAEKKSPTNIAIRFGFSQEQPGWIFLPPLIPRYTLRPAIPIGKLLVRIK